MENYIETPKMSGILSEEFMIPFGYSGAGQYRGSITILRYRKKRRVRTYDAQGFIAVYWEHRSFKEQGIDREPTIHIGAVASALERKGRSTVLRALRNSWRIRSRAGLSGGRKKFNVNFIVKANNFLYNRSVAGAIYTLIFC